MTQSRGSASPDNPARRRERASNKAQERGSTGEAPSTWLFVLRSGNNAAAGHRRQRAATGCRQHDARRRSTIRNEGREGHHRHHARRRENLALRVSPRRAGPVPDLVRGFALPVRDGRGAGLSAVSVARNRPGRMVHRPGLHLCACRRARRRPVRRRIRVHGAQRAAGLSRADRLDRQAAVVQWPDRRHRPVVLRDGAAMADGEPTTRRGSPASRRTTAWSISTAARTITAASTARTARSGTRPSAPTTSTAPPAGTAGRR